MAMFINTSGSIGKDGYTFTLFDDAMISMGYARTFASTGELIWFEGGQRVEGFTNLLWTLWMALIHLVGLEGSSASLAVSTSSFLLLIITSLFAGRISMAILLEIKARNSLLYSSIICGCIPFLFPLSFWSLRGMETGLLSALLMLAIYSSILILSENNLALKCLKLVTLLGLSVIVGVATRLDFAVPATFIVAYTYFRSKNASVRKALIILVAFLAFTISAILLWQLKYYGEVFPNTYYLKMTGFSIFERLERGIFSSAKFAPFVFAALIIFALSRKSLDSKLFMDYIHLSLGCVLLIAGYSTWVGGDAWESFGVNRYNSIALPILVVLIGVFAVNRGINEIQNGSVIQLLSIFVVLITPLMLAVKTNPINFHFPRALYLYALILFAVATILLIVKLIPVINFPFMIFSISLLWVFFTANATPTILTIRTGDFFTVSDDFNKTIEANEIKTATLPEAKIAVSWAGAPGYYSERYMIDLLGKSDRKIAHSEPIRGLPAGSWNEDFYPGHNKFDYAYSIGQLKPDIVVDLVSEYDLAEIGYLKFCTKSGRSLHVLRESKLLVLSELSKCGKQ